MMHGTFNAEERGSQDMGLVHRARDMIAKRKWLIFVVLPTALVWLYYGLIAANQYESEAHFLVRTTQPNGQTSSGGAGLGAALGMLGGGASIGSSDASSVSDYLRSHDAVEALVKDHDLVARFRRPEADILSRLVPENPSPERLLKFYRKQIEVNQTEEGIAAIRVRSFRPQDSYDLVNALLTLGEQRVNILNRRAYESSLQVARRNLALAEEQVRRSQAATTAFRQGRRNIDPVATGQAQIELVKQLQASLAEARARRTTMAGSVVPSSPQYRAVDARVRALEGQVNSESARLSGGANAIAANVGDYQGLLLRQQFAAKRYDDAAATLQRASEQASRQQLFIVRTVEPNMPVKALYPKSAKVIFTVFITLLLCYALGWLIAAGVREHSI